ncbi:MAG: MOSC domain-containing protein [Actinobacteria bacterium]|nr:MOSC domain-containing protein [Actinomycetota bacterium]
MAVVRALHRSSEYTFTKERCESVDLVAGLGVAGDVHSGATVRHRSRVERDPSQPNLRQVHLFDGEVLDQLAGEGFGVTDGALGENITTDGLDVLSLPTGTLLRIGDQALVALTGIRNPCAQIEARFPGLLKRMVHRDDTGELHRLTGAMSVVLQPGTVRVGDAIEVQLPPGTAQPLPLV